MELVALYYAVHYLATCHGDPGGDQFRPCLSRPSKGGGEPLMGSSPPSSARSWRAQSVHVRFLQELGNRRMAFSLLNLSSTHKTTVDSFNTTLLTSPTWLHRLPLVGDHVAS